MPDETNKLIFFTTSELVTRYAADSKNSRAQSMIKLL